jgi:hypothetical protein
VNYDLLEQLVAHVHTSREYEPAGGGPGGLGAVLVFLPGMAEIQRACDRLAGSGRLPPGALQVCPPASSPPLPPPFRPQQGVSPALHVYRPLPSPVFSPTLTHFVPASLPLPPTPSQAYIAGT